MIPSIKKLPILPIILTALITAALVAGGLHLAGFQDSQKITAQTDPDHDHEGETGLWTCGMHPMVITKEPGLCPICNMELIPKRDTPEDKGSSEREIVYWKAQMDPMEIYNAPGKSKMGMDLVPVYKDEIIGGVDVSIDPVTVQNMGLRTQVAKNSPLVSTIRTYGHITPDETRTAEISPKVNGWIETLYVDYTGSQVQKGDPLLEIYSPELLSAQEEYLSLFRRLGNRGGRENEMLESARLRLQYFDVGTEEINALEASGKVKKTVLIRSPFTGVVTFKSAVQGSFVKSGTKLFTIADLSKTWVEAHIYEYELDRIKTGQDVTMVLPYLPGETYEGKVTFIYPYLQPKTRDIIIRLEFENPDLKLKPEMYGDVMIHTRDPGEGLVVPAESIIRSGERNLVFVTRETGKFTPRVVKLGRYLDDNQIHILEGLAPGDRVVRSGQFLLDSESKLQEAIKKMMNPDPVTPDPEPDKDDGFFDDMTPDKTDDFF
nr:efflux RND transporter periplasmic adaptor subunit [uncultured Desulfobacter sp.]